MFIDPTELARAELSDLDRSERLRRLGGMASSVGFHLLLVTIWLFVRFRPASLNEAAIPPPLVLAADESRVPVQFFQTPLRPAETPIPQAVLSDRDARAHGGDPSLPPREHPSGHPTGNAAPQGEKGSANPAPPATAAAPSLLELKRAESPVQPRVDWKGLVQPSPADMSDMAGSSPGAGRGALGDPEGGFVDQGGLAFDTKWFDWGPYGAEMVRRIKQNWRIPDLARVGMKGVVVIRFQLLADGRIADEQILKSSGIPPFDNAAFEAIADAAPYPPLPADLGSDREGVTVSFYYNMQPPK